MRVEANQYLEPAVEPRAQHSPILCIDHDTARDDDLLYLHSHPEPAFGWSVTASLVCTVGRRDWLIPPGYGIWVPGGVEHAGSVLHAGEMVTITFDPERCPVTWTDMTSFAVGPLLGEVVHHLARVGPGDRSRPAAEALMFELLTPLPAHHVQVTLPTDPRARAIAEQLIADPADQRDLADWAAHVHAGIRTLSRLFRAETGLTFTAWRAQVRVRAATVLLADGTTVNATARAVGYHKPSAFIATFRQVTGHTPGTYLPRPQRP